MGLCNSCMKHDNTKAYKSELDAPLIRDIMSNLPQETKIIIVKICNATNLPGITFSNTSDPYVELKLRPSDKYAGEQIKSTSKRPQTLNPIWEPPEKFQFIVSDIKKSKIIFSLYHYNGSNDNNNPLGDGVLTLNTLINSNSSNEPQLHHISLINPSTGKTGGEVIYIYIYIY